MPLFSNLEFHRTGIGLVPDRPGEKHTAIYVATVPGSGTMRSCTCAVSKKQTCDHLKDLSKAVAEVGLAFAAKSWEAAFALSVWYRLARLLFEGNPQASAKVRVLRVPREPVPVIRVTSRRARSSPNTWTPRRPGSASWSGRARPIPTGRGSSTAPLSWNGWPCSRPRSRNGCSSRPA